MRRPTRGRAAFGHLLVGCALTAGIVPCAFAQTVEPPPEAREGEDYEAETADSLDLDELEMSLGATGRSGGGPRRTRRVRFSADSLDGGFRHGANDPLSGGSLEGRTAAGSLRMGRLAPRWGRGLVLGGARDPWTERADDRGTGARYRGRAGEGAWFGGGQGQRYELLYGRFARRSLAGARGMLGGLSLAGLAAHDAAQGSLGLERGTLAIELAGDQAGRWRTEATFERSRTDDLRLGARVRGGSEAYHLLAEPARSGPSRALAVWALRETGAWSATAHASMWRFRAGLGGARMALAFERSMGARKRLRFGFEEQRGARRANDSPTRRSGIRQGWWWAWQGGSEALTLALLGEAWGRKSFARDPARVVSAARVEARGRHVEAAVTHTVFRVGSGESLYIAEASGDRLVLRALTGIGERTRVEARVPLAGGYVRATAALSYKRGARPRSQWTFDWTRRARFGRRR